MSGDDTSTNSAGGEDNPNSTNTPAPAAATASPAGPAPDQFAGTTFGGDANVAPTDNILTSKDPRDFMYGRSATYAQDTAANERATAATAQAQLTGQGAAAGTYGAQAGQFISGYGQNAANTVGGMAQGAYGAGMADANRAGAQANYGQANNVYAGAQGAASQLENMQQGPSGAQAQLQSGLNQSEASNLALARSGHGFGSSASALTQAVGQNAAATQQATNSSAQLSAQETAAWNAQHAQNLAGAAGIQNTVGQNLQGQALTNAQLQQQTTQENDQAQAALMGQGITGANQAGTLGLNGIQTGIAATQQGFSQDMQGTQAGLAAYGSGEQMAGINMSAQQQADLTKEQGYIQEHGINAGVAAGNQAALNSGWGTALSTAGAIGATGITAASDANAKMGVQPLDHGPAAPPPMASDTSAPPPPVNNGTKQLEGSAIQGAGSVLGGAIGSAIAPGAGTVVGSVLGGIGGKLLGNAITSDITTKDGIQPDSGPMGYGMTNPSGSTAAGAANAFSAGRGAAAASANSAADNELRSQVRAATIGSLVGDASKGLGSFGQGQGGPSLGGFEQLGGVPPSQTGYGMQAPNWGSMVTSDEDEKYEVKNDMKESPPPPPPPADRPLLKKPHPKWQIWTGPSTTSDEDTKMNSAALDMVDEAPGYSYEYKDPARHGYGQHFGPMAQDLLRTPAGASTVEKTPDGTLAVNGGRLSLVNTAALHSMHRENSARFDSLRAEIDALKNRKAS